MTKKNLFVSVIAFMVLNINGVAQNKFSNCSAIFLNQKMVVDDYSPKGKCLLQTTTTGQLTVCTAVFSACPPQNGTSDRPVPREHVTARG